MSNLNAADLVAIFEGVGTPGPFFAIFAFATQDFCIKTGPQPDKLDCGVQGLWNPPLKACLHIERARWFLVLKRWA